MSKINADMRLNSITVIVGLSISTFIVMRNVYLVFDHALQVFDEIFFYDSEEDFSDDDSEEDTSSEDEW